MPSNPDSLLTPIFSDVEKYQEAADAYERQPSRSIKLMEKVHLLPPKKRVRGSSSEDPKVFLSTIKVGITTARDIDGDEEAALVHGIVMSQVAILSDKMTNPDDPFALVLTPPSSREQTSVRLRFRSPRFARQLDATTVVGTLPELRELSVGELPVGELRARIRATTLHLRPLPVADAGFTPSQRAELDALEELGDAFESLPTWRRYSMRHFGS